jgi:hypothetical protein
MARKLDRQKVNWARVFARTIRAGVASVRKDPEQAARELGEIVALADMEGLRLIASAARRHLGRLQGGDAGQSLVDQSDAWMSAQAVRNPARMAQCVIPGFSDDL